MTNKSIGSFLSELRKEKGITQKELADYLNVSDKTVSHWECDKYSPDISVIPVLAEFFGVTCDEILKGERKEPEYDKNITEAPVEESSSEEEKNNNDISFGCEPLTKDNEFARYSRIRLHNAFSKMKLTNVIAIFVTIILWAVSWTVIQLIEHKIGLHNFELYAIVGSAVCSAIVGAIIILSSHLKFMSMVNMCPFEEVEFLKWRRMARSILVVPLAILVLICIITYMSFMPLREPPVQTATDTFPYYEEDYVIPSVDASEDYAEVVDSATSVPTSETTDSGVTQYADTSCAEGIFTD